MQRKIALAGIAALTLSLAPAYAGTAATGNGVPAKAGSAPGKLVPKSPTGSYIVVMKSDPLIKSVGAKSLAGPQAQSGRSTAKDAHNKVLDGAGVARSAKTYDYANALSGFAVKADQKQASAIAANPEVAVVVPDELRQLAADDPDGGTKANPESVASGIGAAGTQAADASTGTQAAPAGLDALRFGSFLVGRNGLYDFLGLTGRSNAWGQGVNGSGVTVGVIDTGIWPEHPSFADDGSYPAHAALDSSKRSACAFGNTGHNANDVAFSCNNKLVGARVFLDTYKDKSGLTGDEFDSARDDNGHGTHTASTAAGNANVRAQVFGIDKGLTSGIAPRAQVIAYKALGAGGGYTSDLVAAIDAAVEDGVDVINYSIGGGAGIVSPDTLSFLFAADAGIFSAVSAGNSGPGAKTIGGPADVPWVTTVGANTHSTFYQGYIIAGGRLYRGASVTPGTWWAQYVDAASAGGELCLANTLDPAKVTGKIVLCKRGSSGRVAKSEEVRRAGGAGMVLYNATDTDTLFTDNFFVPTVMIDYTPGMKIKEWIASTPRPMGMLFNAGIGQAPFYSPTMAVFSSRGENPTAGDVIKPDITAPGVQIMAGNTPRPVPGEGPAGQLFQAIAGTSMSSPVVAGSYALLKQAHPDWSAAAAKSALMTTAYTRVRDNDRVSQAGPFAMGAGMAYLGQPGAKGSAFQPGLVYDASINDYLGFLCAEGREAFSNPDATCARLAGAGIPTRAADLNLASIGVESVPGATTVTRTVTSVAATKVTYTAVVTAPDGYNVTVTPNRLTLAPGQSAKFTVTFTNKGSAPADQWRFGALTWRGGGYAARSPLAVKGTLIAAPAAVKGTGTTGSATIPVQFGFAGPYTATAHGLVPVTQTPGTISQDPDRTYPSSDDGAGVVKLPFTLQGVDLARWTLNLPGDDDLDLYLLGPNGKQVASSGGSGTNEKIELVAPADGTYTLVVHGWGVGKPDTPFTVKSWLVPTASGGSLTVTSGGSATAVIGATQQVGVAWSGLTAGTSYLGTVTHASGATTLARTLVEVTG